MIAEAAKKKNHYCKTLQFEWIVSLDQERRGRTVEAEVRAMSKGSPAIWRTDLEANCKFAMSLN